MRPAGAAPKVTLSVALSALILLEAAPGLAQQESEGPLKLELSLQNQKEDVTHQTGAAFREGIKIKVTDAQLRPLQGALVVVTLSPPEGGPGAELSDGATEARPSLDLEGMATVSGLKANRTEGRFQITAEASFGGEKVTRFIEQRNLPPPPRPFWTKKKVLIIGAVAAAVAISVVALRRPPAPSVTITSSGSAAPVGSPQQ